MNPDPSTTAESVAASLSEAQPSEAAFNVGTYPDGSGPVVRVSINTESDHCPEHIWIDGGDYSDQWVAFDWRFADELIAALYRAKAILQKGQS